MPPEPAEPARGAPGPGETEPPTSVSFRVDPRLTAVKVAGAVIFLLLTVAFAGDLGREFFGATATVLLAVYATRDLIAPRRLAADAEGVTLVSGFAGRRRLAWSDIERVRVDTRSRLGTRSELLEIDTGDRIHLFSGYDLGTPVWRAARDLAAFAPPGLTEVPAAG
jgi:hypothetical protein